MYRLFYISKANEDLSSEEIDTIVEKANQNNGQHRITGAMSYNGESFAQILEGDETLVKSLFSSIAKDPRHSKVEVLKQGPADGRAYLQWGMMRIENDKFEEFFEVMSV